MALQIPGFVDVVTAGFDAEKVPLLEEDIAWALWKSANSHAELTPQQRHGLWAELAAFQFEPTPSEDTCVWGTYFGPIYTGKREDGTPIYNPYITDADGDVLAHWQERTLSVSHPVMKARYADLVWDLSRKITGDKPNFRFASTAIDAYVETTRKHLYKDSMLGICYVTRALNLALSIHDQKRIEVARDAMFDLFDVIAEPKKIGTWHFLFDALYENKKVPLSQHQKRFLIDSLEKILLACIDPSSSSPLNLYAAYIAVDRLAKHYRRTNQNADAHRVADAYGRIVESLANKEAPTMAMSRLQQLFQFYLDQGMAEDAKRVQLAALAKGKEAVPSMRRISHAVEVNPQQLDEFVTEMTEGGIEVAMRRIAIHFIPSTPAARKLLEEMTKKYPVSSSFPSIYIADNQFIAGAGSVDDDPDGQLYLQIAQSLDIGYLFLGKSIDKLRERYAPKAEELADFFCRPDMFDPEHNGLVQDGVAAYLDGDHVKAVHVLVPQIEYALRNLLVSLGSPPNKPTGGGMGTMQLKNLNDILREPKVQSSLGEDMWRYLLAFLADARGQNLRNRVSHGLLAREAFSRPMSDRVFHVLLTLALIPKKAGQSA